MLATAVYWVVLFLIERSGWKGLDLRLARRHASTRVFFVIFFLGDADGRTKELSCRSVAAYSSFSFRNGEYCIRPVISCSTAGRSCLR